MAWRLLVIDGADMGSAYPLPQAGPMTIGNSRRHVDVCLHDLLLARIHCQVEAAGGHVVVTALDQTSGTLVNGQKINKHELQAGDVVRVGNSYLRLEAEPDAPTGAATPPPVEAHEGLPDLPADRLADLCGHTLGHYEIGHLIGHGAHGAVFRAHDQKTQHAVALKVLAPEFPADPAEMQRFVQTMRTLMPLRHPHLVNLLGAGRTGPYVWIARELVEGETVHEVLQRGGGGGKTDWRRGLRVAVHVGRALEHVHRQNLIHGNITPANVLVRRADQFVQLSNLLLLQALEGSKLHKATRQARLVHDLPYASPEQTDANAFLDRLTDIYSLGAVVYAYLTGRPPFAGTSLTEVRGQIRAGVSERPRDVQPAVPPELDKVVMKMLAVHQEDRYQDIAELQAALERCAEEEEVAV